MSGSITPAVAGTSIHLFGPFQVVEVMTSPLLQPHTSAQLHLLSGEVLVPVPPAPTPAGGGPVPVPPVCAPSVPGHCVDAQLPVAAPAAAHPPPAGPDCGSPPGLPPPVPIDRGSQSGFRPSVPSSTGSSLISLALTVHLPILGQGPQ